MKLKVRRELRTHEIPTCDDPQIWYEDFWLGVNSV